MKRYEITKYENKDGIIEEQEWIAISDIGGTFGGVVLTPEKYQETEDKYVKVITRILEYMNIQKCSIKNLVKCSLIKERFCDVEVSQEVQELYNERLWHTYDTIKNGNQVDISVVEDIIRLLLREDIYCKVYVPYRFKLFIGYDYMTEVLVSKTLDPILKELNEMGLYVFEF